MQSDGMPADRLSVDPGPSRGERAADQGFRGASALFAAASVGLVFLIILVILRDAWPAIQEHGGEPILRVTWNPLKDQFGLLPALVGTIVSSLIALMMAALLGVAIAIFLTQDFLYPRVALILKNIVDLLAAVPSVVYGLWGMAVVVPLLRPLAASLNEEFAGVPIFSTPLGIGGLAPAAIVLAIMILPTVAAISRDSLAAVDPRIKEAAYGLGATRWQAIVGVMIPTAAGGIFGGLILGFGRALGETMALAMLMGNRNELSWSIFAPGNTLAALIANNYKEAGSDLVPILIYASLLLLVITMIANSFGTVVLQQTARRFEGGGGNRR